MTTRIIKYQCLDELGQRATFTVDKKGKQNSPSFPSFNALLEWALIPSNYSFLAEMRETNKNRYTVGHGQTWGNH